MARIRINWRTLDSVAPTAAATGDAEEQSNARSMRAEKPMMIYITADDQTGKYTRKLEDIVFANEQLGIGVKFFDTIKVTAGNALQDRILKDAGRYTPRIVFLSRDYKVSATLQKTGLSAGKILKAMKRLASKEYVNSFERMVRGYVKLLNELDRLEGKRTQLADMRNRLQAKPSPSKLKKIEREEKQLRKDMADWLEREKKLKDFRRKGEKRAEA